MLYFKSTDVFNERWQSAWIIPAFWQVLSFSLLCVICALWAPSQNSRRYAYTDEGNEFFDKEESLNLSLIRPGPLSTKDVRVSTPMSDPKSVIGIPTAVSNNEDVEEDKRE